MPPLAGVVVEFQYTELPKSGDKPPPAQKKTGPGAWNSEFPGLYCQGAIRHATFGGRADAVKSAAECWEFVNRRPANRLP